LRLPSASGRDYQITVNAKTAKPAETQMSFPIGFNALGEKPGLFRMFHVFHAFRVFRAFRGLARPRWKKIFAIV
jgi:hypothetical protein